MNLTAPIQPTAADARMTELLDSVRGVFAAKGFDRASMQDLAQAAGMSAGNFYRYFPSKDAIIETMVERDIDYIRAKFALLMQAPEPMPLLRAGLEEQLDLDDCDEGAIWAEILAAAKRRVEVGALFDRLEQMITGFLVELFGKVRGIGRAEAETRYRAHATLIFMLIQGVKMRRKLDDDFPRSPLRSLAMKTLNRVLDEVEFGETAPPGAPETKDPR